MKRLEFYKAENGKEPFSEWLDSLDRVSRAKVMSFVERVALGGSKKNVKPVGQGVMEIKIDYGSGYRAYFGEIGNVVMLLLVGGDKDTQDKDIRLAQTFWRSANEQR